MTFDLPTLIKYLPKSYIDSLNISYHKMCYDRLTECCEVLDLKLLGNRMECLKGMDKSLLDRFVLHPKSMNFLKIRPNITNSSIDSELCSLVDIIISSHQENHKLTSDCNDTITLYFTGKESQFDHDLEECAVSCYDSDSQMYTTAKIQSILDELKLISRVHYDFIFSMVETISIQKYSSEERLISGSRKDLIGAVGLVNVHTASDLQIIDALIHEATHSFLYIHELVIDFYKKSPLDFNYYSPWTGRNLSLRSFTHACFVWYNILNFSYIAKDTQFERKNEDLVKLELGFQIDFKEKLLESVSSEILNSILTLKKTIIENSYAKSSCS